MSPDAIYYAEKPFFPTDNKGLCLKNEYAEIVRNKLLKYRIRTENV
jgi:hypothetical protein